MEIESDLLVKVNDNGETREGVTKIDLNEIFGTEKDTPVVPISKEKRESIKQVDSEPENREEKEEKTQKEVFAEVKALTYGFNFTMVTLTGLLGSLLKKDVDAKNISASEVELTRLAKVAQPVYEKYFSNGASPEALLVISILGIYGFRIAGELLNAPELAKKTTKQFVKTMPNDFDSEIEDWKGNPDFFQTGNKAGKMKPSRK
jgi:hypothetical protein